MQKNLNVIIRKKDQLLFSDSAESVSSINDTGSFDVLPYHKSFVCIIKEKIEVRKTQDNIFSIPIERGIFQVRNNQVEIYLFQTTKN